MTNEKAREIIYDQWQEFLEHNLDYAGISEAYKMAIQALEQIKKVKEIIIQHDSDMMPEDFWYIDKIREAVNE